MKIQSLHNEIDCYRKKLPGSFGINKQEEIVRLFYEIALREGKTIRSVYDDSVKDSSEDGSLSYKSLKTVLMRRRFPDLTKAELSKVLLTRVKKPEAAEPQKGRSRFFPKKIYIDQKARNYPLAEKIIRQFPDVPQETISSLEVLRKPRSEWLGSFGKDQIVLTAESFDFIKKCPCTDNSLGCNYTILNLGFGCPYDCSYCYLQFYQNTPAILIYVNPASFLEELDKVILSSSNQWFRIGTGEFTDSLALDWLTRYSKILVPYFKNKNVIFELKTKSSEVENLLELDHGGKTVISWSLNPACYEAEESGAALLEERIEAARKCQKKGYPVAFHFDPIFYDADWEKNYQSLVEQVYDSLEEPPRWFSLGTFRFHRDLKKTAEVRHPNTRIFLGNQIEDKKDGKFRYPQRVRIEIYQKMLSWIRKRDPEIPVYLCMEPQEVWKAVFHEIPFKGRIDKWIAGIS